MKIDGKRILVTGGTGSLGKVLVRRLLSGEFGTPDRVTVLSRDEAKQHEMRLRFSRLTVETDEIIYRNFSRSLRFRIGDVRDLHALAAAMADTDIVVNAAALKQVPTCEYFPEEAYRTNVGGAANIVTAIRDFRLAVETVVGVSTDKAVKPVNVMGMTKALQERVLLRANLDLPKTRFMVVRYGNVLASRGSVVPLFLDQIRAGGPLTITHPEMTRFLLSLDDAVDVIAAAVAHGVAGETFVPRVPAARMADLAAALIGDRPVRTEITGVRPGEKLHEVLISEEEVHRTVRRAGYYAIRAILPELPGGGGDAHGLPAEYSSAADLMPRPVLQALLAAKGLAVDRPAPGDDEVLA